MIKKYKIAFYGFGHAHINTLYKKVKERDDFEITHLVEPNASIREATEEKLGVEFSNLTLDGLLSCDFDVLAVGTAYGKRAEVILKALSVGKHVIADKPICTKREELEKIKALQEKNGLALLCMLDLRYLKQTQRAREILLSGMLGEVKNISFNGQHYIDPKNRPLWYFEDGMHGGTINDLAIHGVDLVRMLTGLEFTTVDAARIWNSYATSHPDFKDCATFMARLENGAGVLADISYSAPSQCFTMPTYWEFRFWCEHGMLAFSYNSPFVTVYKNGEDAPTVYDGIEPVADYLDELILSIESGAQELTKSVILSTAATQKIQEKADITE